MTHNATNVVAIAGNDNARGKKGALRIAIGIFLLVGLFAAFKFLPAGALVGMLPGTMMYVAWR